MKSTQALAKKISRLALTTKQTNKGFYKGTGSGSMGEHTKHGGFIIRWEKVRTYVPPENLKDFKVESFHLFKGLEIRLMANVVDTIRNQKSMAEER